MVQRVNEKTKESIVDGLPILISDFFFFFELLIIGQALG